MLVCISACMNVCIHADMHVCIHAYMHVCMYVCMYACVYVCMHVCMSVRVCVCICISACTHVFHLAHIEASHNLQSFIPATDRVALRKTPMTKSGRRLRTRVPPWSERLPNEHGRRVRDALRWQKNLRREMLLEHQVQRSGDSPRSLLLRSPPKSSTPVELAPPCGAHREALFDLCGL